MVDWVVGQRQFDRLNLEQGSGEGKRRTKDS